MQSADSEIAIALHHALRLMNRNISHFEPTGVLRIDPWAD
jgi:predicted nucleic acid-binding protein